jgi:phosphoenolpyruvate-protein kinase (PTS system EI component)
MSEVFAQPHQRMQPAPNSETIAKMLDENTQMVITISEHYNKGRMQDTIDLQKQLHRNLVYLACLAYPNKPLAEMQSLLPVKLNSLVIVSFIID